MRRFATLLVLVLAGCSTAPLADVLDRVRPGRIEANGQAMYGGVNPPPPLYGLAPPPPSTPARAVPASGGATPATLPPAVPSGGAAAAPSASRHPPPLAQLRRTRRVPLSAKRLVHT